jgi:hypothetical protein
MMAASQARGKHHTLTEEVVMPILLDLRPILDTSASLLLYIFEK